MIADSLKISKETMESNTLSSKRKRLLRHEAICRYIESQPVGTPISLEEFRLVARFKTVGNTHAFIKNMLRDKKIARHDGEKLRTFSYSTLRGTVTSKTTVSKAPQEPKIVETTIGATSTFDKLEVLAKEFAWANNSDSLREFVIYAKGRV